jgi:hypothetical protein
MGNLFGYDGRLAMDISDTPYAAVFRQPTILVRRLSCASCPDVFWVATGDRDPNCFVCGTPGTVVAPF